jgi:UDP:flavonoid glycosyltransferase YjiC (YdhE family)
MQNKNIDSIITNRPLASQSGKKILFACVPADGHFNPLTGIAKHLQSLGYDVRWYSSMTYADKLNKIEIPFYPFKKALDITGDKIDDMFPERQGITNEIKKLNFDLQHVFILRSTEYLADIQEIYESFQFDLMISDCVFTAYPFCKRNNEYPRNIYWSTSLI